MKHDESAPRPELDDLLARVFDGTADDGERERLARMLESSAAARGRLVDHATLREFLREEAKAGGFATDRAALFAAIEGGGAAPVVVRRRWFPWVATAAAAAVAGLLTVLALVLPGRAEAALEQVIAAFDLPLDRVYQIKVVGPGPDRHGGESAPGRTDRGRFPPAAFLDGARLHLRGGTCFVVIQSLPGGVTRVMGGDGHTSWSIRGDGPVRVSEDPGDFGGRMLAGGQEISFLQLRGQLAELRRFYQLERFEVPAGARPGVALAGLRGVRRSAEQGGARLVELWFDPASGLIHRVVLDGLPRGGGAPAGIVLELVSTEPLAPDFFTHQAHHDPGRPVEHDGGGRGRNPQGGHRDGGDSRGGAR